MNNTVIKIKYLKYTFIITLKWSNFDINQLLKITSTCFIFLLSQAIRKFKVVLNLNGSHIWYAWVLQDNGGVEWKIRIGILPLYTAWELSQFMC
jgi:hypothetical protein